MVLGIFRMYSISPTGIASLGVEPGLSKSALSSSSMDPGIGGSHFFTMFLRPPTQAETAGPRMLREGISVSAY